MERGRRELEQLEIEWLPPPLKHADMQRLGTQRADVWRLLKLGRWWTLADLAAHSGHPEASVSARIRDFRRPKYGSHSIQRRRAPGTDATWEYRLAPDETRPAS